MRDAAYNSLLFSEREVIHGEIADVLMGSGQQTRPEILAHHLTAAQRSMPAIEKWCEAGEAAKLRSANAEAIEYLKKALSLVEQLGHGEARDECELTVLLALIAPLRAAQGFAATRCRPTDDTSDRTSGQSQGSAANFTITLQSVGV